MSGSRGELVAYEDAARDTYIPILSGLFVAETFIRILIEVQNPLLRESTLLLIGIAIGLPSMYVWRRYRKKAVFPLSIVAGGLTLKGVTHPWEHVHVRESYARSAFFPTLRLSATVEGTRMHFSVEGDDGTLVMEAKRHGAFTDMSRFRALP